MANPLGWYELQVCRVFDVDRPDENQWEKVQRFGNFHEAVRQHVVHEKFAETGKMNYAYRLLLLRVVREPTPRAGS